MRATPMSTQPIPARVQSGRVPVRGDVWGYVVAWMRPTAESA